MGALLQGKKTYLVGGLMVAFGIVGGLLGKLSQSQAIQTIGEGLSVIFLRAGISKLAQ